MADNKMPFVTSKALKRTPATKENKDRIKYMDSHEFSFKFDKVTGKFLNSENALDFNQGITYVLLSDDKDFIIGYFNISVGRIDQIEKVMDHTYYIPMGGAININYLAVDKRLQHTLLVPEAKIYYGDYMSTFVQDSDKNCKKLYKWVDDILEG